MRPLIRMVSRIANIVSSGILASGDSKAGMTEIIAEIRPSNIPRSNSQLCSIKISLFTADVVKPTERIIANSVFRSRTFLYTMSPIPMVPRIIANPPRIRKIDK